MKQIADHFSEAIQILQKFNTADNHALIETAGEIMVTALQIEVKSLAVEMADPCVMPCILQKS